MTVIRVVDSETSGNGVPPDDGICELAFMDIESHGANLSGEPADWRIGEEYTRSMLTNPGKPISVEAMAIHHITDEDVRDAPPWRDAMALIGGADIYAAHSAKSDAAFITPEYTGGAQWACTYKAALRLWPDAPRHSLQALRYYLQPPGLIRERGLPAHRALPDAYVCAHILLAALDLATLADIIEWSSQPALLPNCHIGAWRGKKWAEVDSGFMRWVLDKDFDEDTKHTCLHWLNKRAAEDAQGSNYPANYGG